MQSEARRRQGCTANMRKTVAQSILIRFGFTPPKAIDRCRIWCSVPRPRSEGVFVNLFFVTKATFINNVKHGELVGNELWYLSPPPKLRRTMIAMTKVPNRKMIAMTAVQTIKA